MGRTLRAALVAGVIGLVLVGGMALFLGIDVVPSVVTGLVAGGLFSGLILAAARRADSLTEGSDDRPRGD